MRLKAIAAALALTLATSLHAQTVEIKDGRIVVSVQQPASLAWGPDGKHLTIYWGDQPSPVPFPEPPPPPAPVDPVPPAPKPIATGRLFVTLVYDADRETQYGADIRAALGDSPEWDGLNASFRAYEKNQRILDDLGLRESLGATPCLLIQERKGGPGTAAPVVKTVPAVPSKEAAIDAVKALRGIAR